MPQLVKKRRSGWAVLAAAALVASILAVGATPAAADDRVADQQAVWKACLGEATVAFGFTDVSMDSSHYDNINCLAYYEITTGKTDDTFDPNGSVTRSQMALFLARAADAAGIELGEAMAGSFTDIGDADDERRSAINRLTAKGIMFGDTATSFDRPSSTTFAPTDYVTRWEMAMFMFAFLDLALDTVHVDVLPATVDGDGTGVELNVNPDTQTGNPVDDYFRDARRETPAHVDERISAVYELGVTTGTNSEVGEDGIYDPNGNVERDQMASFIIRALNHTNLRPKNVSAQQTDNETQVSVRNADFEPVPDVRVEVFTTNDPDVAFDDDGECVGRYTAGLDENDGRTEGRECQIEVGDLETDGDGNASYGTGTAAANATTINCAAADDTTGQYTLMTGAGDSDYKAWAWTGDIGDEVDDDTARAEVEPANLLRRPTQATKAIVSGGNPDTLKMGETLTYTVQLADARGDSVSPTPGAFHGIEVTTVKMADNTVTFQNTNVPYEPDVNGTITIPITNPDPNPYGPTHRADPDVTVTVTVAVADGNNLPLVDMTMGTATETDHDDDSDTPDQVTSVGPPTETFSDDAPTATTIAASPESTYALLGSANGHTIGMMVFDQYGDLFKNSDYMLRITPGSTAGGTDTDDDTETGHLYNSGRRSLSYDYGGGRTPSQETITISGSFDFTGGTTVSGLPVMINWADLGVNGDRDPTPVLQIDTAAGVLLVNIEVGGAITPILYYYGDDDKFVVEGVVLTYDQFQEVAALDLEPAPDGAMLSWEGFNYNRRNDNATWRLTGVICPMASAGD